MKRWRCIDCGRNFTLSANEVKIYYMWRARTNFPFHCWHKPEFHMKIPKQIYDRVSEILSKSS